MARQNAIGNKFLDALLQRAGNNEVISLVGQEAFHKVLDSREIWNILRAQSKSKLAQLTEPPTRPSIIRLVDEQRECRRLAEEKERSVLERCRVTLMYKASEFNQERTALLIAYNPLHVAMGNCSQAMWLYSPCKYLPTNTCTPHLPQQERAKGINSCKLPPLIRPVSSESKKQEKASTGSIVPSDAMQNSERRRKRCKKRVVKYDHETDCGDVKKDSNYLKEPLTISALIEEVPSVTVPGVGAFKQGQASIWKVESSYGSAQRVNAL
ncbi:testis-specific gene 13 protein-like isoform X3 [Engraulis encrasicolus]|uniref:testis-specific gene 13 protein-like isoform X3 n=1 Tax=Engraulis encrasicolus TaxID=184585 RepID=UPI002FD56E8A